MNRKISDFKNNNLKVNETENTDETIIQTNTKLKKAKQEISILRDIKNRQDGIVNDLNSQLSLLKAKQLDLRSVVQTLNKKTSSLETTNIELKELFILKDFESNGIKPSDLSKRTNPYSTPKNIVGNSTIYAVQFGVFMQVQAYSTLKVSDEVWYEKTEHGTYVYLSGQFKNPQDSVDAYIRNLNSHGGYIGLRRIRECLINNGQTVTARALSAGLISYSSRGVDYIDDIRSMIRVNKLEPWQKSWWGNSDQHSCSKLVQLVRPKVATEDPIHGITDPEVQ